MNYKKSFSKAFFVRAALVIIGGIVSYLIITRYYSQQQRTLTLNEAEVSMTYAKELLDNHGDLWMNDGKMYAGSTLLNQSDKLVKRVKKKTGFGCTIFQGNERISTTATAQNTTVAAIGTKANDFITEKVLAQGETFKGITNTLNKDWLIVYEPLMDDAGDRIGMMAVFKENKAFKAEILGFNLIVGASITLFAIAVFILLWRTERRRQKILAAQDNLEAQTQVILDQKNVLEELSIVASKVQQAIIIIGKDDLIQWVNESFYKIFGYTEAETIGKKTSDLIAGPETDRRLLKKIDEHVFQKKKPYNIQVLHYRKDGSSFWANVYLTPILNEKGALEKYIAISQDISQEVEAKKQLEQSEANFRQISETISDVFYLYNVEEQKYEYISSNSLEVLGADDQFFYKGKSHTRLVVYDEDRPKLLGATKQVESGEAYDIEFRVVLNDEVRWIRERSYPIVNNNGEVVKNVGICTDITKRKRAEEQLRITRRSNKILAEIGLLITRELSITNIIDQIHKKVNMLLDAPLFAVGILEQENNRLVFPRFIEHDEVFTNASHSLDENVLSVICIKKNTDIIIGDFEADIHKYTDKQLDKTDGEQPESLIYLPLRLKGEVIGVITVQSFKKHAYTESQIDLLRNLSIYVANAIANSQLYETLELKVTERTNQVIEQNKKLEKSYARTKLLSEIGRKVSSSLSMETIFQTLYKYLNQMLDAEIFGVRLYHAEEGLVEYKYEIESGQRDEIIFVPMTDKDNYTVWCIENKRELIINDNEKEYSNYVKEIKVPSGEMPHSLLFFPMIVDGEVTGVITVQSLDHNAYDEHDLNILRTLASYTGAALANAQLYETMEMRVKERTAELRIKNDEVTSSINYAQRIQQATLTADEQIKAILPDSFLIYKPKDIVSGDFYRVDIIHDNEGNELYSVIVGDCTGHGVPGATLAVLCSNILKASLTQNNVNSPGEALDYVAKQLKGFFQSSQESHITDGLDVLFCVLNPVSLELYYSGAFLDCLILRGEDFFVLKGDRKHVGYDANPEPFTTQTFQCEEGDQVYLTTDGFVDQFGGPLDRKFTMRKLVQELHQIRNKPLHEQGEIIDRQFEAWRADEPQTDDVCVFGFSIHTKNDD